MLAIVLLVDATGECDYDRMHQMLLESTGGRLNPRRLFCDRQTDIGASARKTWPSLDVSDIFEMIDDYFQLLHCWSHLRQCARSRLEQDGLVCLLDCDDMFTGGVVGSSAPVMYTFYIWIRIVYALAYVPKESVLVVYDSIEWPDVLHEFLSRYFEGLSPVVTFLNCNMFPCHSFVSWRTRGRPASSTSVCH